MITAIAVANICEYLNIEGKQFVRKIKEVFETMNKGKKKINYIFEKLLKKG